MNIILTVLLAAVIAFVCYLIVGFLPFLAPYANIVGLIVFVLVVLNGARTDWTFPRRG